MIKRFPRVVAALPKLIELEITICEKLVKWDIYDIEINLKREVLSFCLALPDDANTLDWRYARGHLSVLLERFSTQCESSPDLVKVSNLLIDSSMLTDADHEQLEVAFRSLPSLQNLEVLSLCTNQLTRLPPYVEKFHGLQHIKISCNQLIEIPPQLRRLPKLCRLRIKKNKICRAHFSFGDFVALEMLNLECNPICNDLFEAKRCIDEWNSLGRNDKVIQGLTVLEKSALPSDEVSAKKRLLQSLAAVRGPTTSNDKQRDELILCGNDISIPKSAARKPVGQMQQKSITRMKEYLEHPDLRITWKDLALRFSPNFDHSYVCTLERKVSSGQRGSPVELFLLDLETEGVTIGQLVKELASVHVRAARAVSSIEDDYEKV